MNLMKRAFTLVGILLALVVGTQLGWVNGKSGSPPQILKLTVPAEIVSDASTHASAVQFQDSDGDLALVEFVVLEGNPGGVQIKPTPDADPTLSFDPQLAGVTQGVIQFFVAATVAQQITLQVTLVDSAGNRSTPQSAGVRASAGALPDLIVRDLSAPEAATLDTPFAITYTLENVGTADVEALSVGFYLSADEVLDAGDLKLGGRLIEEPLVAGGLLENQLQALITTQTQLDSVGLASDRLWLVVAADDRNEVAELEEVNNTAVVALGLGAQTPNQGPQARFSFSPENPQVGDLVTFDGTESRDEDGQIVNYAWSLLGGAVRASSDSPTLEFTFQDPGTHEVTLTVTDNGGLSDSVTRSFSVRQPAPPPLARFSADVTSGPAPLAVRFSNTSENFDGSNWDFGDGSTSMLQNPTHTYTTPGNYSVRLTVRGPGGEASATLTVRVAAAARVLYQDNFSNDKSGWRKDQSWSYTNGEYRLFLQSAFRISSATLPDASVYNLTEYCAEVDIKLLTGSGLAKDGDVGFYIAGQIGNPFSGSVFVRLVFPGDLFVSKTSTGAEGLVQFSTITSARGAVDDINEFHTLRLKVADRTLTVFINDQQIVTANIGGATGEMGLMSGTLKDPNLNARFDNVKVLSGC